MKSFIAKLPMPSAIGLYLGDQEIAISQVACDGHGIRRDGTLPRALRAAGSGSRAGSPAAAADHEYMVPGRRKRLRKPIAVGLPAARFFFVTRPFAGRGRHRDGRSPLAKGAALAHHQRRRIQCRHDQEPVEQGSHRQCRGLPAETIGRGAGDPRTLRRSSLSRGTGLLGPGADRRAPPSPSAEGQDGAARLSKRDAGLGRAGGCHAPHCLAQVRSARRARRPRNIFRAAARFRRLDKHYGVETAVGYGHDLRPRRSACPTSGGGGSTKRRAARCDATRAREWTAPRSPSDWPWGA